MPARNRPTVVVSSGTDAGSGAGRSPGPPGSGPAGESPPAAYGPDVSGFRSTAPAVFLAGSLPMRPAVDTAAPPGDARPLPSVFPARRRGDAGNRLFDPRREWPNCDRVP